VTSRAAYFAARELDGARSTVFSVRKVSGGEAIMLAGKARRETSLLSDFTFMILGAFIIGMPMALAIIWLCS
jgi:hypothetical protein